MSSSSVPNVGRDVLWERAVASLPPPLAEALRSVGLDDPNVLVDYPRSTLEELGGTTDLTPGGGNVLAPSGAASSGKCTTTSGILYLLQLPNGPLCLWAASQKTVHASFTSETGGDPRTDHASLVVVKGGDPRTDHASLCASDTRAMAATCCPCRPGGACNPNCIFRPCFYRFGL